VGSNPAQENDFCLHRASRIWKCLLIFEWSDTLPQKVEVVDFEKRLGMFYAQGPKGARALKFYQSAGFCKIYYSHFIFKVITFLKKNSK
jgi:hypothetical protein